MGRHMAGWGVPRTTGRVWAYLLTQNRPVSLDELAAELGMAKSGVSVATRQLVGFGLARSLAERGSRRLLYEALSSLEAILAARNTHTGDLLGRLRQGAEASGPGPARHRLAVMADELQQLSDEMPRVLERIRQRSNA